MVSKKEGWSLQYFMYPLWGDFINSMYLLWGVLPVTFGIRLFAAILFEIRKYFQKLGGAVIRSHASKVQQRFIAPPLLQRPRPHGHPGRWRWKGFLSLYSTITLCDCRRMCGSVLIVLRVVYLAFSSKHNVCYELNLFVLGFFQNRDVNDQTKPHAVEKSLYLFTHQRNLTSANHCAM